MASSHKTSTYRLEFIQCNDQWLIHPVFVTVRLLQVPSEPLVEHRRAALTARARRHFFDLELVDSGHLVCDEVHGTATGVADDKLSAGLQDRRAQMLEGVERRRFLGSVNMASA